MGWAEANRLRQFPIAAGSRADDGRQRGRSQIDHRPAHAVVAELRRHDLAVLVTIFPPSLRPGLPETYLDGFDGPLFRLYFENVMRVAEALRKFPAGTVALEPMNEPQSDCRKASGLDWTDYQEFMIGRIRRVAPELTLFLTGGCWSSIDGVVLLDSDLLRDKRNFVSVHFYYPFIFTHQTAGWTTPFLAGTVGVPYPASAGTAARTIELTRERFETLPPSPDRAASLLKSVVEIGRYFSRDRGRATMAKSLRRVADWQRRQQIPSDRIVFTEFGAMKQMIGPVENDKASRARWLHDASSLMEEQGWGWNVWVLRDDPFGLYVDYRELDADLLRALGLGAAPLADRIRAPGE